MATPIASPRALPARPVARILLVVFVILLLALDVAYVLFLRPGENTFETAPALSSGKILEAVALPDQKVLGLTSDNRFVLLSDGKVTQETQLDTTVTALTTSQDASKVYAGTNDRQVVVYDDQLNELGRFAVNGRVTSVAPTEDGAVAVGYGIGRYTGRFYVGKFDEQGTEVFTKKVGPDVNAVTSFGDTVAYADVQGKMNALSNSGEALWSLTLTHPAVNLAVTDNDQILAGDERGGVTLVSSDGKQVWYSPVSQYKIRMVAYDRASNKVIAGDDDGKIFLLDMETGQPFYKTNASASAIRGFAHASATDYYMVSESGEWIRVNLALALGSGRQRSINLTVLGLNILLLLGVTAMTTLTVPTLYVRAQRLGKRLKESRTAYLLILPSMLMILIFAYIPTFMGLYFSFTNFNLSEPMKFVGLHNFIKLVKDEFFWVGVGNMLLIMVTSIAKSITIPLLVAELIFWLRWAKLKYWMRVLFIIPSIVPGVVAVLLWKQIYDPYIGLINEVLRVAGLEHLARPWLSEPSIAIWAIIFTGFPWVDIFAFLIYFGGLLNISHEIFDAAAIDGAAAWKRFRVIDWPMIQPQIRLILFFTFLGAIQGYGGIWVMTRGGPGTATYVPGLQMFLQVSAGEYGYASAIGFVLALVILTVTVWRFRFNKTPDMA
jgi:ABC-type sugar transport system permease subunit